MRLLIFVCLLVAGGVGHAQTYQGTSTYDADGTSVGELNLKEVIPLSSGNFLLLGSHAFDNTERDGVAVHVSPTGQRLGTFRRGGAADDEFVDAVEHNGFVYILGTLNLNNSDARATIWKFNAGSLTNTGQEVAIESSCCLGARSVAAEITVGPDGSLVVGYYDSGGVVIGVPGAYWSGGNMVKVSTSLVVDEFSHTYVGDVWHELLSVNGNIYAVTTEGGGVIDECQFGDGPAKTEVKVSSFNSSLQLTGSNQWDSESVDQVLDVTVTAAGSIGLLGSTTCSDNPNFNNGPENIGAQNPFQPSYWLIDNAASNFSTVREVDAAITGNGNDVPQSLVESDCFPGRYVLQYSSALVNIFNGTVDRTVSLRRFTASGSEAGDILVDHDAVELPNHLARGANGGLLAAGVKYFGEDFGAISLGPDYSNQPDFFRTYRYSDEGCSGQGDCVPGPELTCRQTFSSNNFASGNNLTIDDYGCYTSPVGSQYNGNDEVYTINHAGGPLTVTLINDTGADLDLFLKATCGSDGNTLLGGASALSCLASSTNAPTVNGLNVDVISLDLSPGTYYAVVDAVGPNDLDFYRITYNCTDVVCTCFGDLCDPLTLVCDVPFFGTTAFSTNSVANYCNSTNAVSGSGHTGGEEAFTFTAPETGQYNFSLTMEAGINLNLFVLNAPVVDPEPPFPSLCFPVDNCVASGLNTGSQPEVLSNFLLAAGDYLVVVDGFDGAEGNFTLSVTCPTVCDEPVYDFTCGNQTFRQDETDPSEFVFFTSDGNAIGNEWLVEGQTPADLSYASVSGSILSCDFPTPGTYEICYRTFDEDDCEFYCCRSYCVDFDPPVVPTTFSVNGAQTGYNLTFALPAATNVSWYNEVGQTGIGALISIPFPVNGCFYRTYTFRYRDADGCWKTARRRMYVCNPFGCETVAVDYDATDEEWNLNLPNAFGASATWFDDDAGGNEIADGTSSLSLPPRPPGSCGTRNISVRYFDGIGWRYCCLRFWDCDPYGCADFTTQPDEVNQALQLTFTGANATDLNWIDDVTGQPLPNSSGQAVVPLPWPGDGCVTRFISVRYYDTELEVVRICCIEVLVCRPDLCDDPVATTCNDQDFYQLPDGRYRITSTNPGFTGSAEWTIGGVPASAVGFPVSFSGNSITCGFPGPATYNVCYPYLDDSGCLNYCCQEYCIDPPFNPTTPDLQLTDNGYRLSLLNDGATNARWYYLDGSESVELQNGPVLTVGFPAVCYTRTFFCRYRTADGCWRVVSRRVVVCDPAECGNIAYQFNAQSNAFTLTLEAAFAQSVQWFDDDNNVAIPGGGTSVSVPLGPNCGERNISVRYFDGEAWRICCLRYRTCDPFECGLVIPRYETETERYVLTLDGGDGFEQISWADDDDPAVNFATTGASLSVPITGPCRRRNVSVRYFNPVTGVWYVCCVSYWQCPPADCAETISAVPLDENRVELAVSSGFASVDWEVGGAAAGAGEVVEAMIPAGQSRLVCIRYFDPFLGYWRTCCRTVLNPECDFPEPFFTLDQEAAGTVAVVNQRVVAGESYAWTVNGQPRPASPSSFTLDLPPGPYVICLTATNDCGNRTVCREVYVPSPASDLIFDLGDDVCGLPGETIEVPLSVRNFTNVTAFQFTMSLRPDRIGRLVNFTVDQLGGLPTSLLVNDSTLAITWIRTDTLSATLANGAVIGHLRLELADGDPATAGIGYAQQPVETYAEYIGGQVTTPALLSGSYCIRPAAATLSGRIVREAGDGIAQVEVALLSGGAVLQTMTTDLTGNYEFTGLMAGVAYEIVPTKDINHRNGVNSGDMSRLQQHIFQSPALASPYQRIAADVSNLRAINSGDRSKIRQLIFQEITRFDEVASWHFVPADYVFPDPEAPWAPAYPTRRTLVAASGPTIGLDFIAVKMGDIGDSALPGQLNGPTTTTTAGRSATDLRFLAVGEQPRRDGNYRVDVLADDFTAMLAAQFSLGWDASLLRFDSIGNLNPDLNLAAANFDFSRTASGQLPWLWFGVLPATLPDSARVFSLHFTVTGEGGDDVHIDFTESPTVFYFEDDEGEVLADFEFLREEIGFPVSTVGVMRATNWVIRPNPTQDHFWITGLGPDEALDVQLLGQTGSVVRSWTEQRTNAPLRVGDLPAGLYYVRIRSGRRVQLLKVVLD